MSEYRLKPLSVEKIAEKAWSIGLRGGLVDGEVWETGSGEAPFKLIFSSEVAIGTRSEGTEILYVASLEEAVALVEQRRLEAFANDIEPADAKHAFASLTDDQRAEIAAGYCTSCWRPDPNCQCWNDD